MDHLWQPFFSLSPFPSPVGKGETVMLRSTNEATWLAPNELAPFGDLLSPGANHVCPLRGHYAIMATSGGITGIKIEFIYYAQISFRHICNNAIDFVFPPR